MTTTNSNLAEVIVPTPAINPLTAAQVFVDDATALVIDCPEIYQDAANGLQTMKARAAAINEEREKIRKPILAAAAAVQAFFMPALNAYGEAEQIVKGKMVAYDDAVEKARRDEQRRLDEEARKQREKAEFEAAEAERVAQEKAAEQRREAEAKRQQEEAARREADEARKRGDEEAAARAAAIARDAGKAAARLQERANSTETAGTAKAVELQQRAATYVAPIIERQTPQVAGISRKAAWKAHCYDLMALVKAVAEGKAPLALLQANETVLGQQARSLKDSFSAPGVRVWNDGAISARRATK